MMRNLPDRAPAHPIPYGDVDTLPLQEEEAASLRDYWIVIHKYRWTILAFLLPIALLAAFSLWWMTPLYTATATLHIEDRSPNVMGVPEAFTPGKIDIPQYYQTQLNLLRSRSLAARVIQDLGLANDPRFTAGSEGLLGWIRKNLRLGVKSALAWVLEIGPVKWLQEHFLGVSEVPQLGPAIFELGVSPYLIDLYLERLIITLVEESQLVKVAFSSVNPSFSKDIVNAHVSTFIRTSLLTRFELTGEARQFLEEKLAELKVRLEKSEEDLNRFRKTHAIVALDKGENFIVERLRGINNDLTQARSRRIELESLYRIVQERGNQQLSQIIDNDLIRQMKVQISALEVEKARQATIFKPTYAGVASLQQQIDQAKGRVDQEVRQIVRSIASDYAAAKARESALTEEMERQRRAALDLREKAIEAAVLEREAESNRLLYDNVLKRTKETDLSGTVPVSNVRMVDRADIPLLPDTGKGKRMLLLSVAVGLLGGIGLAFIRYYLDNTLKTPEDVRKFLRAPTLGLVPDVKRLDKRVNGLGNGKRPSLLGGRVANHKGEETALAVSRHPYSVVAESYQTICTGLLFSLPERPPRTILITSSQPKEGKTATAINIAVTMARNSGPVLLIDADLRNGCCHKLLGLENGSGLTDVLTGNGTAPDLIKRTSIPKLDFLSRGKISPNPAQLLGSEKMQETLDALATTYAFIIIDSAPVLPINDSPLLSTKVDGVVLVIKSQEVSHHIVRQARERLAYVKARFLGVVLNSIDLRSPEYKDYRSSYVSYYTSYPTDNV
jgi:polysaccharide biosynthesis transport protein